MILLDFIMANTDRHYNNFAFLRNSNTLEWIGLAPIYDTGTSMFYKISTEELKLVEYIDSQKISAKPFYKKQQKQLEFFSTIIALQEINFESLKSIPDFYTKLLSMNTKISTERKNLLATQLKRRIEHAQSVIYRKNEITKKFLNIINNDKTDKKFMSKVSSAFLKISSENPAYKAVLSNYLRVLKPQDEQEMESLILRDIKYFFHHSKKNNDLEIER